MAAIWALVVLAVLTTVIGLITWQTVAGFRQTDHRHYQIQALWLARSGIERAAARLLAKPDGYTGETISVLPNSEVRIEVAKDPEKADTFVVKCQARYPTGQSEQVLRTQSRRFRRSIEKGRVRLAAVAAGG